MRTPESWDGLRTAALCGGLYNKHLPSLTGKTLLRQNCNCFPSYVTSCRNSSACLPFPESFQGGPPSPPPPQQHWVGALWPLVMGHQPAPPAVTTHSASRQDHVPPGGFFPGENRWASPRRRAGAPHPPAVGRAWEVMRHEHFLQGGSCPAGWVPVGIF